MKIFQINTVCGTGSTGKIAVDLAKGLKANGHKCVIAFGRGKSKNWDNTYCIATPLQTKLHALYTRFTDKHALFNNGATKKLIAKIRFENPDIIHLHNLHGYYLNAKILFEFLAIYNKPIVWTLHDCWNFTGHCTHFVYEKCERWRTQCCKCPQKKIYPASLFLDNSKSNYLWKKRVFNLPNNLTIVTPSNWLKDLVEQSFLASHKKKVINNGIDLNVFKPTDGNFREQHSLDNIKIVLGVANVWGRRKGLDDLMELSKKLSDDYKIVLVGVNKKQQNTLPENILALERTANAAELAHLYTTADVFVNPTYEDNYPTVNLEALVAGTPVVTYNTGGSVESVLENNICEQGNIDMLKTMIERVALEKKEIVDKNVERFDKKYMIESYLELYNKIMIVE